MPVVRLAEDRDLDEIIEIWLEGAESAFHPSAYRRDDLVNRFRRNFHARDAVFAFWVAEDATGRILGWQSLLRSSSNPFRADHVAESSTYIRADARGEGLGTRLLVHAVTCARETPLQYLLGYVSADNVAARRATAAAGWVELGELPALTRSPPVSAKVLVACIL